MSSIFQKPKVRPNLGHNGFDLSRRRLFTSPCGMLLPIFWDFASPGEKYKCNSSIYVRTEAISTAAMMRLKAHVDWFFVPVTQLYSLWNEFFNQTEDIMSTALYKPYPAFHLSNLPHYECTQLVEDPLYYVSNFTTSTAPTIAVGEKYQPKVDEVGTPYLFNFRRLWDMLGYGSLSKAVYSFKPSEGFGRSLSLFPYLAYHKIFHSKYLLTDWFKNDPTLYNLDKFVSNNSIDDDTAIRIMSTIHYRPYRTDYFTNILPSPTFSDLYANSIAGPLTRNEFDLRLFPSEEGSDGNNTILQASDQDVASLSSGVGAQLNMPDSNFTAGDIRALFAMDKLLRVTAFAGSHYEDQTLAHFGYKIPQGISKEAYSLGEQVTDISINEVVATSQTDPSIAGGQLGDIAGKGFGSSNGGKSVDFTAPCHGILMAIYSIEPLPEYASVVQERKNLYLQTYDFYHPEFDNVGMQPFSTPLLYSSNDNVSGLMSAWTYRYSELKSNFDVVNESLWDTSRASWQGNKQMPYLNGVAQTGTPQDISRFNTFYIIPQYTNSIFKYPYKSYADLPQKDLFVKQSDLEWSSQIGFLNSTAVYSGDNFINNVDIQCYKVSPMSVHSLPKIF